MRNVVKRCGIFYFGYHADQEMSHCHSKMNMTGTGT